MFMTHFMNAETAFQHIDLSYQFLRNVWPHLFFASACCDECMHMQAYQFFCNVWTHSFYLCLLRLAWLLLPAALQAQAVCFLRIGRHLHGTQTTRQSEPWEPSEAMHHVSRDKAQTVSALTKSKSKMYVCTKTTLRHLKSWWNANCIGVWVGRAAFQ